MPQRHRHSLLEVFCNYASGMLVAYGAGLLIFPMLHMPASPQQNGLAVLCFTGVSVLRSYVWRRIFNWLERKWH